MITALLRKEIYGMLLGKMSYSDVVEEILDEFKLVFGEEMILVKREEAFHHMGYFRIEYQYIPLHYTIVFESDRNVFVIDIFDEEGAKSTLYGIEHFQNETNKKNVQTAVSLLRKVLRKNDFYFYITKNEKLYRKKNKEYKRIKDIKELMEEQQ